jgi:hypothetical protein|mmetsp:Transcript_13227/g.19955  ORF Transcript_13227/g.19955 Transcript_13227/m.19955 type:complete len:144 (+) Transcript_13227:1-432(+)
MLVNVSYNNPEIKRKVDEAVGKPFSFRERIKQRGIGLGHLIITASSTNVQDLLDLDNNRNKCNIELRPQGIIIGFRSLLESFALVIPYWKLNLYKGKAEEYSFYMDHHFIKIEAQAKDTRVHSFVKRILSQKTSLALPKIDDL